MKKNLIFVLAVFCLQSFLHADPPTDSESWNWESTPFISDDFNSFDTLFWDYRTITKYNSTSRSDNVSCSGGKLLLKVEKVDGVYYCGGIISKTATKYGYYEISAKLPDARGWHPSFFLYGSYQEIDAFEFDTGQTDGFRTLKTGLHDNDPTLVSKVGKSTILTYNPQDLFKVYAMEFNPYVVRYFADGKVIDIRTFPEAEGHGDNKIYLTVIKSNDTTVVDSDLVANFEVDYIDVWKPTDIYGSINPLVLMLDFESDLDDASDKNNNVTSNWIPTYSSGLKGDYAINFSADGDKVTVADTDYLDGMNQLSIAMYLKPDNIDSTIKPIIAKRNNSTDCSYTVFTKNGKIYVDINAYLSAERVSTVNAVLTANTQKHLAIIFDGTASSNKVKIYINGIAQAVTGNETDSSVSATNADLTIGYMGGRGESFRGDIDDVKIMNYALTPGQVAVIAGSAVLNISFDDANRLLACDLSGYNHHGTLENVWWTNDAKIGSSAIQFCALNTGSYVAVPDSSLLDASAKLTLMAWVKPAVTDGINRGIISKRVGYNNEQSYSVFTKNGNVYVDIDGYSASERISKSSALTADIWTHITVVYDGTISEKVKLYINAGTPVVSTVEQTTSLPDYNSTLYIGALDASGGNFSGIIDDVRIYRKALNQTQITSEMNRWNQ
ncbi:MAG: family 16 glycosylhydrolase [Victivallaceae bacterium]|nr:family 16 glycosylhydrolase [Victivallaceae bacterium]